MDFFWGRWNRRSEEMMLDARMPATGEALSDGHGTQIIHIEFVELVSVVQNRAREGVGIDRGERAAHGVVASQDLRVRSAVPGFVAGVLDRQVQVHGILTAPERIDLSGPQWAVRLPVQADGQFIRRIREYIFIRGRGERGEVVRLILSGCTAQPGLIDPPVIARKVQQPYGHHWIGVLVHRVIEQLDTHQIPALTIDDRFENIRADADRATGSGFLAGGQGQLRRCLIQLIQLRQVGFSARGEPVGRLPRRRLLDRRFRRILEQPRPVGEPEHETEGRPEYQPDVIHYGPPPPCGRCV